MSTLPLITAPAQPGVLVEQPSERRTWERWLRLAGGRFGYALADQVIYSFGNMVVAAMLSRHCAQRQFGIYILTQRAMDVLIQLSNVFLWGPFTFNLPGLSQERKTQYQGSIFYLQLLLCALFTSVLWLASMWTNVPARSDFHATFQPLIISGAGILFREFTRRMYFAQMRMQEAFWTDVATVALQIAGVLWLHFAHQLNVTNTLYVLSAAALLVSVWWLLRDGRHLATGLRGLWRDLRFSLELGRWFLGSNMVFMASSQCNPWVLGAALGGSSVGAYAICESVVNIPRVALTSMQNVMGPAIAQAQAEGGKARAAQVVKQFNAKLLTGSALCGLAICLAGPWVARLIFKSAPANARSILFLLALNLVAYAATLAQSYGLTAFGRADTTFFANAIGLIVQALLCLFLVHRFGVLGAAAAMLLGTIVVLVARSLFYKRALVAA